MTTATFSPTASSMVHVRLSDTVKEQATQALAQMGISLSEAVRMFLTRVVTEQRIPFEVKVPNAKLRAAMVETDDIIRARKARFTSADALFAELDANTRK